MKQELDYEHGEGIGAYTVYRAPALIAENTFELQLVKPEGMRYRPGSAMKWYEKQPDDTYARRRTFSLVSSPHEPYLVFAYRGSNSDFKSRYLASLKVGDTVHLRDPQDEMRYVPGNAPFLMIAGGIGITPMISLLRYGAFINATRSMHLVYTNPAREKEAYHDWLDEYATTHPLMVTRLYAVDGARIHAEMLRTYIASQSVVYIAGPESMTRTLRSAALEAGANESRVQVTDFSGYAERAGFE